MKTINISKGKVVMIDDEDFQWLSQFEWRIHRVGQLFYAIRNRGILMHREILGLTNPKTFCDHKDRNGLNNCRNNLRIATYSQNNANMPSRNGSSSKYLGVGLLKAKRPNKTYTYWIAQIQKENKLIYLGCFINEIDAALAYNKAAIKFHGEFANLNVVQL